MDKLTAPAGAGRRLSYRDRTRDALMSIEPIEAQAAIGTGAEVLVAHQTGLPSRSRPVVASARQMPTVLLRPCPGHAGENLLVALYELRALLPSPRVRSGDQAGPLIGAATHDWLGSAGSIATLTGSSLVLGGAGAKVHSWWRLRVIRNDRLDTLILNQEAAVAAQRAVVVHQEAAAAALAEADAARAERQEKVTEITFSKLDEIHSIANSNLTASIQNELDASRRELYWMQRTSEPDEVTHSAIVVAKAHIEELGQLLTARRAQERKAAILQAERPSYTPDAPRSVKEEEKGRPAA